MSVAPKWVRDIADPYQRTVARFMDKVVVQDGSKCWQWGAATDKDGYGTFHFAGPDGDQRREKRRAHRVSFELFCGDLPDGMLICHTCDNTGCVNPRHLFLGSTEVNVLDRVSKSRSAAGASHGTKTKPSAFIGAGMARRKLFDFRGRTLSLHEIAVETNIPLVSLRGRVARGWGVEQAVTTPAFPRGQGSPRMGQKGCA